MIVATASAPSTSPSLPRPVSGRCSPTSAPSSPATRRFQQEMGAEAAQELAVQPITAAWRREHILAPVRLRLDSPIYDLTDVPQRHRIEERHVDLLLEHDMRHLDLHEITTSRRVVTQAIAADI